MSMGMIITSDLVPIEHRGVYQSYINLAFGLGSASGAALGGFLCDRLGWRWTFGIQVPYILVLLATAWITTPTTLGPNLAKTSNLNIWQTIKGFDLIGSFLLTLSVTFLILGLNLGGNVLSWGHPVVITSLIASCMAAIFLLRVEARAVRPVMPLELLVTKPRANLIFTNFLGNIAVNTILFNVPLYFQAVKLDSATDSGFRLAAPSLGVTVAGVATGFIITWTRRIKPTLVLGSVCFLIGSVCMACIWPDIPNWVSTAFVTPASLGQGFAFPSTTMGILAVSSQEDQAIVSTTLGLWRSLGMVMGVALSSLILQNALVMYLDQLVTGMHKADIIYEVRRSVHAIVKLDPYHQKQGRYRRYLTPSATPIDLVQSLTPTPAPCRSPLLLLWSCRSSWSSLLFRPSCRDLAKSHEIPYRAALKNDTSRVFLVQGSHGLSSQAPCKQYPSSHDSSNHEKQFHTSTIFIPL